MFNIVDLGTERARTAAEVSPFVHTQNLRNELGDNPKNGIVQQDWSTTYVCGW